MKTAIYIEDGVVQLVITPETKFEQNAMSQFEGKELQAKLFSGTFYDSRGGWVRQQAFHHDIGRAYYNDGYGKDRSLILRVDEAKSATEEAE